MSIEYQKGNSFMHRLDARTKLILFVGATVAAMIIIDPIMMGLLFVAGFFIGQEAVCRNLLNRNLRVLMVIFLTFSLFQVLFFTPKNSYFLFYLIPWKNWVPVTIQGLVRGVAVFFRFFIVVLSVHLMLYPPPPVELALTVTERGQKREVLADLGVVLALALLLFMAALPTARDAQTLLGMGGSVHKLAILAGGSLIAALLIRALISRGLPPEMGMALTLGFATVGILSKQTQQITNAQKARGYDTQPKNLVRRVQVLTALLIPIFLATLERSQDISIAILSRGYDYNIGARTYRRNFEFQRDDFLVIGCIFALILFGLLLNSLGWGNPTENMILSLVA